MNTNYQTPPMSDEELDHLRGQMDQQDLELQEQRNENFLYAENLRKNLDRLLEKWGDFYYAKYSEHIDRSLFMEELRINLLSYIDDISGVKKGERWESGEKFLTFEEKYKELLNDDLEEKQEKLIKKVGARAKVFSLLGKILGK